MTKASLPALVLAVLLPCGALAQTTSSATASTLDAATKATLVRLGGQLMLSDKAFEYERVLADEIGPRLTGSSNYVKAADWAYAEFNRLSLSNVHREPWEITATWEPETWAVGRILTPYERRLHLESDGWSPSTPPGGVRGSVYRLTAFTPEAVKAEAVHIKDAVVLIDDDALNALDPFLYGKALDAVALIASGGARAMLWGVGATNNVPTMLGLSGLSNNGSLAPLPVGSVGREDSLLLRRLLDRGPVEVEFTFTNRIREHVKVDNIVAEIPGSDSGKEFVLIGGHLDSWHLGTGAQDNGTGAATVLAVAEAIKATGIQPRRTLRFVLFGGEEQGMRGSTAYVRAHISELDNCAAVFISDSGSEPPKGWDVLGRDDEKQALAPIKPLLDPLDAGGTSDDGDFALDTDNASFTVRGVPSFVLWTELNKYSELHHRPSDTFDKVNEHALNLGVAVVGVTALAVADAPQSLKHLTQTELEEQFKKLKKFESYQDVQTHNML